MNSVADIWSNVLTQLNSVLSDTTLSTWFDEITAVELTDATFVLYCPNAFKKGYIEKLFIHNIQAALFAIFSREFAVELIDTLPEKPEAKTDETKDTSAAGVLLDRKDFTFDQFVVGPSNKLAYAAAQSVAEHPAQNYNPLFIYGDSGLGKTHLLSAIAHVIHDRDGGAKIAYVKGDDFTNELVQSIREGKNSEFREKYREADLLLVDDIQFIAGKQQTQEEFFHTFNKLYESKKQIVLTSDLPPKEMLKLEDRLRTRFEWGLLVDVTPPDLETRIAIIRNKAASMGMDLSPEIADFIAENVTANVRQIEGTINKILAYKELLGTEMDEETINQSIRDMLKRNNEYVPSPDTIIQYVCRVYSLSNEVIRGQQRSKDAVLGRQVAMYLIRRMTTLSLSDIGREFGGRDHSTVLHSVEKVEKEMAKDNVFNDKIREIITNINARQ